MQRSQHINQIFDIVVPLLLYFVWDWDLHFILLFAYVDSVAGVFVSFAKEYKIETFRRTSNPKSMKFLFRNLGFVILGISFYELAISQIYPNLILSQSFINFLMFKEMGIPQFALIFPLIIVLNYQQYQLFFIKSKAFQYIPLVYLQNKNRNTWLLFTFSGAFLFGLSTLFQASPLVFLFLTISIKALIDFILIPHLDKNFVQQYVNSQHDFPR